MGKEQLDKLDVPPDWLPNLHPPMPFIVKRGREKGAYACAEFHQIEGHGFLSTVALAGLPASYIIEQIREFRSGRRVSRIWRPMGTRLPLHSIPGLWVATAVAKGGHRLCVRRSPSSTACSARA